jgi:hypothetical protein
MNDEFLRRESSEEWGQPLGVDTYWSHGMFEV